MYLWTSGTGLGPRGGLVVPDQNNILKRTLFFIRLLDRAQIFTEVSEGRLPY